MCGFVGLVGPPGSFGELAPSTLLAARARVDHRGPDAQGMTWRPEDGVALAFARLRILDMSSAADQPLWSADGRVGITFNGEIYNYRELRAELEAGGACFRSHGDTEVFLEAYLAWGDRCVDRFHGMWAAAVIDLRGPEPRLYATRDRMGEKPLFWHSDAERGVVSFASELAALQPLLRSRPDVDPVALRSYLTLGYVPSPHTMLDGVSKLRPGCALEVVGRRVREWRWWSPPAPRDAGPPPTHDEVRDLVTDAVERRRISDVPIGVLLSGGIDSTIVTSLLARHGAVRTFSAAFDVGPRSFKYNVDADAAEHVARSLGTDHTRLDITLRGGSNEDLQAVVRAMGEPHANGTSLTTMLLARQVRASGVPVVLTGDGSDELFGGYDRYRFERWVGWASAARLAAGLARVPSARAASVRALGQRAAVDRSSPERYLDWWRVFPQDRIDEMLVDPASGEPERAVADTIGDVGDVAPEDLTAALDLRWWIPDESNARVDHTVMASGVEARAVFEDHLLVERLAAVPMSDKVGRLRWRHKQLLVESFADVLPPEVLARPKWGWISPVHYWVNDDLWDDLAEVIRWLPETGLFTPAVARLVDRRPTADPSGLWTLAVFGLWHRWMIGDGGRP